MPVLSGLCEGWWQWTAGPTDPSDEQPADEVTPATLIAEVAVVKVVAEVYPETSGVITLLVEENQEVPQCAVIAQVT